MELDLICMLQCCARQSVVLTFAGALTCASSEASSVHDQISGTPFGRLREKASEGLYMPSCLQVAGQGYDRGVGGFPAVPWVSTCSMGCTVYVDLFSERHAPSAIGKGRQPPTRSCIPAR